MADMAHCTTWNAHSPACLRDGTFCSRERGHVGQCVPHGSPASRVRDRQIELGLGPILIDEETSHVHGELDAGGYCLGCGDRVIAQFKGYPLPTRTTRRVDPCPCECNSGGFCGGCGHAGCSGGINLR